MIGNKCLRGLLCASVCLFVVSCSGDKDIPQGKRISVLSPSAAVKPDVANGSSLVQVPSAEVSSEWLQNDYNAQHIIPNLQVSPAFNKQWSADFGEGSSKREKLISKPLAHGEHIYTLDADGQLSSFNLKDGEAEWYADMVPENKYAKDNALKGAGMVYQNNVLYVAAGYGDVYAVNAKNGEKIWSRQLNFPLRIAPVIAAGKLFIQSVDNKFFALDIKNGETVWQYDISMENTTIVGGASAAYCPALDVVVTGFSSGELQAFNASIGTPLWSDVLVSRRQASSSTFLNTVKASPVVEGETVYALGNGNILTAVDIRSGMRIWEKEIGGTQTPLLAGNVLYVVSKDNDLIAVDKKEGKILWAKSVNMGENPAGVTVYAPVMFNGRLIISLSDGVVYTYSAKTGEVLSKTDLDEDINSAPIAAGEYVLFVTDNAKLIAYK